MKQPPWLRPPIASNPGYPPRERHSHPVCDDLENKPCQSSAVTNRSLLTQIFNAAKKQSPNQRLGLS
ncbi:MAG: hypothetical protein Fues2KO_08640 [Fuerstiella sp.]